ncbi:MAG: UvrD-helicase domain-containing protein [Marmoricola sp.]
MTAAHPIEPAPFDILGPLPEGCTTTVLEASAGTGKTFTVGALVARYVAEGVATLDEMLVITFGRAASQELRERVREQLVAAERALAEPSRIAPADELLKYLASADVELRHKRITDALAGFDGATIATTHQFCQLVLRSLGVAGDTDSRAQLVESLDDLVVEVTDDLYLRQFGSDSEPPQFDRSAALRLARAAVGDPLAVLAPSDAEPGSKARVTVDFAHDVRDEVERRKHRRGVLSYDDLLSRLANALVEDDAPARERMRQRWKVVLVDEFQDTDPVQWDVLDRAFTAHATLILIGDPKQAIYAFRGGDVVAYLKAAGTAASRSTLATNWRTDAPLVDALQKLSRGAELGDTRITVLGVEAHHQQSRLVGAPASAPFRLRQLRAADFPTGRDGTVRIDALREHIAVDLASDVARLLGSGATFEGRPIAAGDVALLFSSVKRVDAVRAALAEHHIPSVVAGGSNVMLSRAADEWLALLEALEQQRTNRVRAVALTSFVGESPLSLDAGGDALADQVAERIRGWLDLFRTRGVAAVHEAARAAGLSGRVLAQPDGERLVTDLEHLGQLLHETARRNRLGLPALLEWFRAERRDALASTERTRRLDTDAAAVQLLTIHGSKGLQYPVVYLPHFFDCYVPDPAELLFHDESGTRRLDLARSPDAMRRARAENAGEELRLTYVALTRAQSQVVTWWGPSQNAAHSGLSRLLFGRPAGQSAVQERIQVPTDFEASAALTAWQEAGALSLELSTREPGPVLAAGHGPGRVAVRRFTRSLDTNWRRTSYSGLIRAEDRVVSTAVDVEPEVPGTVDEGAESVEGGFETVAEASFSAPDLVDVLSPMADLPAGATFGSLVHGVLEHADPQAPDLRAELRRHIDDQRRWWSVETGSEELSEALLPMQHTRLGPLAGGLRLVDIGLRDRLRELDFEFPLVGGDRPVRRLPEVHLDGIAGVLRRHLVAEDPMRVYADRLESPSLGGQVLRGYLSGSIDVVLRVPLRPGSTDHRYVVVDYKTNKLGDPERPLAALDYTPALMTEAMLHSHYPLQALLYSVVLHRYLRWRLTGYDPERHLGGILYLYVRGMCGPETPEVDGQPCGVFAWHPPAAMVLELSDLLAGEVLTT